MKIFRLRNLEDYIRHADLNKEAHVRINKMENSLASSAKEFTVPGVSYPANKKVDFKVDYKYSDGVHINWRERLVCPETGLSNRLRSSIQVMDIELSPYQADKIYITEQVTPLFDYLKQLYPNLIGSEYLGNNLKPGLTQHGIRHEDMTNLSFADSSMDHYLSFECFEHIPAYQQAIPEIYRVLKPGGHFLGTFPFDRNVHANIIRAKIENGKIVHLMEPEYHGDPVNEQGILCFTVFGWEMLEEFRNAGFKDAYAVLLWSDLFGYLGGEQVFIIAKK